MNKLQQKDLETKVNELENLINKNAWGILIKMKEVNIEKQRIII